MEPAREYGFPCSVARVTDLIGDPWTPLILRDAVLGVRRYDDFHRLQGIGRNTLSQRLRKLVDAGILYTRLYQDNPPRNEYLLTDKGRDLFGVLAAMGGLPTQKRSGRSTGGGVRPSSAQFMPW